MSLRLKSVEMQGYKTFASPVLFEFSGPITAVVGPNGSGKSNISDAVRWVLGEQSFGLLRARKTDDMIFSGSEARPRAGMASVTITFDNVSGWLPIDFSEVSINRRAYRDGQSEYRLNGQKVRLRDISELLAGAGLAERTYTIIGQGLVDAALSLKAEERRRLFEEAAGIGLYRSRRSEALRRLVTTNRNLERVEDILAELKPRLRSLERQAQRAKEYDQLKADLRLILREWYGYHWHRTQDELAHARQVAKIQEENLEKSRQIQKNFAQQMGSIRERISELRGQLATWQRETTVWHQKRERIQRDMAVSQEKKRALQEQHQQLQLEIGQQEDEIQAHRERVKFSREQVADLKAELEEARLQAQTAEKAQIERESERRKIEQQVQSLRQAFAQQTARREHLMMRVESLTGQLKDQEAALETSQQALVSALRKQKVARQKVDRQKELLKEADQVVAQANEGLQKTVGRLREQEQAARQAEEKLVAAQTEFSRLQARAEVLTQAENSLEGYSAGAQNLLKAIRAHQLAGEDQALSAQIDVPAALETAIGAALGAYLDAVVLPSRQALETALRLLEEQPGRAALLDVARLQTSKGRLRSKNAGCVGNAAELVKSPGELQPVIELLLGRVLVVKDRAVAQQMLPNLAQDGRLVTLQGEVFAADGTVLAGQQAQGGILSRTRERRDNQDKLSQAEKSIQQLRENLEKVNTALVQGRHAVDSQEKALQAARANRQKLAEAVRQTDLAFEQDKRQFLWQQKQVVEAEQFLQNNQAQVTTFQAEIKSLASQIEAQQQTIRDQQHALNALPLEEFRAQAAHWNTRTAVSERAWQDALTRAADHQRTFDAAEKRLQSLQNQLAQRKRAFDTLLHELSTFKEQESHLAGQIAELEARIAPAEQELQSLENQQKELIEKEETARSVWNRAERSHTQAQLSLSRRQESLDNLRNRIEDDFGLVAFEYAEDVSGPTPLPLDGMVEKLPHVTEVPPDLGDILKRKRSQLRRMGAINQEAQQEFQEVQERFEFMTAQVTDLEKAREDIKEVISELDLLMEREFRRTFDAVAGEFRGIFTRLFGGGSAQLLLTDPEDLTQSGIDIEARLPGRRKQGLALLSGGERSLTAAALVFALLRVSPTPFCVMDEVDAMLDEANVGRFRDFLSELSQNTQFIVITHNRNTVQAADVIYGITMGHDSASQVISLKLDELSDDMVK